MSELDANVKSNWGGITAVFESSRLYTHETGYNCIDSKQQNIVLLKLGLAFYSGDTPEFLNAEYSNHGLAFGRYIHTGNISQANNFCAIKSIGERSGHINAIRESGEFCKFSGTAKMYLERDKLPIIAWVKQINNNVIPHAYVILVGRMYNAIACTDEKGLMAGYFDIDVYGNAIIISANNIVYHLIASQYFGGDVYEYTVKRSTKSNATYRQLHRKFV